MRSAFFSAIVSLTFLTSCENDVDDVIEPIEEEPEDQANDTLSRFVGQYIGTMVVYDSVPSGPLLVDTSYTATVTVGQSGADSTLLFFTSEPAALWNNEPAALDSSDNFYYGYIQMNYHRIIEGKFVTSCDPDSLLVHTQVLQWTYYGSFDSWFKGVRIE